MAMYVLRPLKDCEPACRTVSRRSRTVHRVPRPDDQLVLDLPLHGGRLRTAPLPQQVPETLGGRQIGRLLTTILEACDGRRPVIQVRPLLDPALYGVLLDRRRPRPESGYRPRSLHVCHPADGAIEACATVEHGSRFLALAARFERTESGWLCTRFHLLEPSRGPGLRLTA
ncbi:Rv3235 family protein [Amycolatopsis sp. lyj-112]|uniref:Rv3235 family protein n=1 Tax=Amycolatopsis sp. lyj-112 TaxID=2789288 RepID=UPI003979F19C